MAMKRVLVHGDHEELLGYAHIDPDNPRTSGRTGNGAFTLYVTKSGSYVVTRDNEQYFQFTRDEVFELLAEAGKVDLLIDMGMIREL